MKSSLLLLRRCSARNDTGNAIIEFVYLALLLMVPLVYVLLTVFRVQGAAFAVSGAAREAGRVFVVTEPAEEAPARALAAAAMVMADAGITLRPDELVITCSADPCRSAGATVDVAVSHAVTLPFLPAFLTRNDTAAVRVKSSHLEVVDRFRATR